MAVTVKDISSRVGLSVPTVVQVLGDRGRIGQTTRARVWSAAREMGYRPHVAAKAMRTGRYGNVALLMSTVGLRSLLPGSLMDGINEALSAQQLHLTVAKLPDDEMLREGQIPRILQEWFADGLLINYNAQIPSGLAEMVEQSRLPSVWINSRQAQNCVYPDDVDAARQATEHLLSLGHQKIAYVMYGGWGHYSTTDRQAGYEAAMRKAGLTPRTIHVGDSEVPQRKEFTLAWLSAADRPTAVVAYSPQAAWWVHKVAQTDLRLSLPQDLSIVSFDDSLIQHVDAVIDTMVLPEADMGHKAVELLMDRIEVPAVSQAGISLKSVLEQGNSCAPRVCRPRGWPPFMEDGYEA